jgi:hypothetical protein
VALATSISAADAPIIIRGLSLDSSAAQLEEALGPCLNHYENGANECGETEFSKAVGYGVDEQGRVSSFSFHCSYINGCSYDAEDLINLLVTGLSLTKTPVYGDFEIYIDGDAGDRLIVTEFENTIMLGVYEVNYRKPKLLLE